MQKNVMNVKQIHTAMTLLQEQYRAKQEELSAQYRDKHAELLQSLAQAMVQDAHIHECDYSINCTCVQCEERAQAEVAAEEAQAEDAS